MSLTMRALPRARFLSNLWSPTVYYSPNTRNYHHPSNRHRTLLHKKARGAKMLKVKLMDTNLRRRIEMGDETITPAEKKQFYKEMGFLPPNSEREIKMSYIASTGAIIDSYVPKEGDGKVSILSKEGAKDGLTKGTGKGKSFLAARKIRSYDEDFGPKTFVLEAQEIYINAHKTLAEKGEDESLLKYVSEKVYPEMIFNARRKTLRWKFIKSLEPPTIVHIRNQDVFQKQNVYSQITVRFHTQQTLAVYDRFGRLIHGSEVVAKDVLEYVVFEKHLASLYGKWRLHAKIMPDWAPEKPSSYLTSVMPDANYEDVANPDLASETDKSKEEEEVDENAVYDQWGKKIKS